MRGAGPAGRRCRARVRTSIRRCPPGSAAAVSARLLLSRMCGVIIAQGKANRHCPDEGAHSLGQSCSAPPQAPAPARAALPIPELHDASRSRHLAPVRRSDDGLDRPPLPLLPSAHQSPGPALYRDGDDRCLAAWRRGAAPGPQRPRASAGAAARRQRAGRPGALRRTGRSMGLSGGEPQLRLSERAGSAGCLRCLPDERARSRCRVRACHARCHPAAGDGEAPHRARPRRELRLRARLRRNGGGSGLHASSSSMHATPGWKD